MWNVIRVVHHCLKEIVRFDDIGGIVVHHCLKEIVRFVDIGGIVVHLCLKEIVCFDDAGGIVVHHCLKEIVRFVDTGGIVVHYKGHLREPDNVPFMSSCPGRWFSPGTPVSSSNKTDRHDITEI